MTQQEFLLVASQATYGINIWVTETEPYTVLGLTVPVYDLELTYVQAYLEQLEQIILPVDETLTVTLTVVESSLQTSNGFTYFFFIVEPQVISTIGDNTVPSGVVLLLPGVEAATFNSSPYNVLQGNAETQQQSSYILQAGSTTRAYVQDSLLSDTGWINARYEGSKTNSTNYGTIEAAVLGSSFEGIYYVPSITDSQVQSQSISNPIYTRYLQTGKEALPTYGVPELPSVNLQAVLTPTGSTVLITTQSFNTTSPQLVVGDLVRIDKEATVGGVFSNEVLKITNIQPYALNPTYNQITYTRGWSGTSIYTGSYTSPAGVYRIEPVRIYELLGNKLQTVSRGKVQIRQTSDIAYTDPLGFVYTGSFS
jgi:hypothetical protein